MRGLARFSRLLMTLAFGLSALIVVVPQPAAAAPGWNAGRIIDDAVFTNKLSMSVGDIQNFLNAKVPTCDTNHAAGPNAGGSVPPWRCLKDYNENVSTGANNLNGAATPAGAISAAQIIWNAAQSYNINPQVLLVTLQKETGLISDAWPYPSQYRTAMGFACPDTAACDPAFFGFGKQVTQAARYFRNFFDENPNWTVPYKVGTRFIRWSPTVSCGGSDVVIQTHGTAALYSYTPYQPNAASLAAGIGTGDGCSSYGNRNFFYWFNTWFGSTLSPTYYAGYNWHFENLDGGTSPISGSTAVTGMTPYAVTFNSTLHSFYYDPAQGNLDHAYADTNGWHFEALDGAGGSNGRLDAKLGVQVSGAVFNNRIHLFYYDAEAGDLRHAWSDTTGQNWQFETVDGNGTLTGAYNADVGLNPTATAYGDGLQLFYYDQTNGNLRHAWLANASDSWHFENLDGDPGSVGRWNSNAGKTPRTVSFAGTLQLYYYDQSYGNLRHAWSNATGWHFENLDGDPGSVGRLNSDVGQSPAITLFNNQLQLFYYDQAYGNLRHAWTDTAGWHFENLDGDPGAIGHWNSDIGLRPTTLVTPANKLYVMYYDRARGNLRSAAVGDGSGWQFANIDGDNAALASWNADVGTDAALAWYGTTIQLLYTDATSGALRHAFGSP